jgi:hypothetical protein
MSFFSVFARQSQGPWMRVTRLSSGKRTRSSGKFREILFTLYHHHTMQTRSSNSPPGSNAGQSVLPAKLHAHWEPEDEAILINTLFTNGPGPTYREPVFQQAADDVNVNLKKGAPKNFESCRTEWFRVCVSCVHILPVSDLYD